MASESTTETDVTSSAFEQLRSSLIILGLMGPLSGSEPDRVVLVNPVTQGTVVLRGGPEMISEILGGGGGGAPPASKASIEAMRTVDSAELEGAEEECSVCLDVLKEEVKEMPCRHRFHGGCIEKWLRMHGSCPVCRFQMPMEEGAGRNKEGGERRMREVFVTIAFRRNNTWREEEEQQQEQGEE